MSEPKNPPTLAIIILTAPLPLMWLFYLIAGHRLIAVMYDGRAAGMFNRIITQQAHLPLGIYLTKADAWLVVISLIYLGIAAVACGLWLGRDRRIIREASGLLIYILFLLVVAEISARVYFLIRGIDIRIYRNYSFRAMDSLLVRDELLGFKLMPNARQNAVCSDFEVAYETNDLGLRDAQLRESTEFRILFLGDSETFGWGVPFGDRFTERIENNITGVQTINAGIPGYGIHQMKSWLEHHGLALRPDLVVLSIIYQDLNRAAATRIKHIDLPPPLVSHGRLTRSRGRPPKIVQREERSDPPMASSITFSEALSSLMSSMLHWSDLYSFTSVKVRLLFNQTRREEELFIDQERRSRSKALDDSVWQSHVRSATEDVFSELATLVSDEELPLLVANINQTGIPWLEPILNKLGIDYADVSPVLTNNRDITFEIDPHYNALGHEQIGKMLSSEILARYGDLVKANTRNHHH